MNRWILRLKRPFIWVRRFRHRCGYGVHSPFAFSLITDVIYERAPYYKYAELVLAEQHLAVQNGAQWSEEPLRVKQLLFRLVNRMQPHTIIDAGPLTAASLYLQAPKAAACYTSFCDINAWHDDGRPIDFLYLHHYKQPAFVEEVFRNCCERATDRSLFVVEGIRYTPAMYRLWQRMQHDSRACITFDLYDLGLIFFDRSKIKQDYIVNF